MSAPSVCRLLRRQASRTAPRSLSRQCLPKQHTAIAQLHAARTTFASSPKYFSTASPRYAGLMPHTDEPEAPDNEDHHRVTSPSQISDEEYHEHADRYMNSLNDKAEQLQETREDVEVEYSAGVMNISIPPNGSYVINKQPPNKQIWLSSPISGPKRFDWVVAGESMHQKQEGGVGDWVYLRDNTSLTDLLRRELAISMDVHGDAEAMKKPSLEPVE